MREFFFFFLSETIEGFVKGSLGGGEAGHGAVRGARSFSWTLQIWPWRERNALCLCGAPCRPAPLTALPRPSHAPGKRAEATSSSLECKRRWFGAVCYTHERARRGAKRRSGGSAAAGGAATPPRPPRTPCRQSCFFLNPRLSPSHLSHTLPSLLRPLSPTTRLQAPQGRRRPRMVFHQPPLGRALAKIGLEGCGERPLGGFELRGGKGEAGVF